MKKQAKEQVIVMEGKMAREASEQFFAQYTNSFGDSYKVKTMMAVMRTEADPDAFTGVIEGGFSIEELMMALTVMQRDFLVTLTSTGIREEQAMEMLADSSEMAMTLYIQNLVDRGAL